MIKEDVFNNRNEFMKMLKTSEITDLGQYKIFTATPTHSAPTGTLLLTNISDVYNLWAMIDGSWRNLTNNT